MGTPRNGLLVAGAVLLAGVSVFLVRRPPLPGSPAEKPAEAPFRSVPTPPEPDPEVPSDSPIPRLGRVEDESGTPIEGAEILFVGGLRSDQDLWPEFEARLKERDPGGNVVDLGEVFPQSVNRIIPPEGYQEPRSSFDGTFR